MMLQPPLRCTLGCPSPVGGTLLAPRANGSRCRLHSVHFGYLSNPPPPLGSAPFQAFALTYSRLCNNMTRVNIKGKPLTVYQFNLPLYATHYGILITYTAISHACRAIIPGSDSGKKLLVHLTLDG